MKKVCYNKITKFNLKYNIFDRGIQMIYSGNLDKFNKQDLEFVNCFVAREKYSEKIEQLASYFEKQSNIKYRIIKKYEMVCLQVAKQDYCIAAVVGLQYAEDNQLDNIYLITLKGEKYQEKNHFLSEQEKLQQLNEKIKEKIKQSEDKSPFCEN